MNTDRRLVLKGLAAAGLAVSGAAWARIGGPGAALAPGLAAPGTETAATALLALTSQTGGGALDAAFLAGVEAGSAAARPNLPNLPNLPALPALPAMQLRGLDAAAFGRLDSLLKDTEQTMLVGLTDDATATLVLDLVRSTGGRVLAVEHHRVGNGPDAALWARALGRSLAAAHAATDAAPASAGAGAQACVSFRCVI